MRTKKRMWKHKRQVASFLLRHTKGKEPQLLLGLKLRGVVAGLVMPPGGHIEKQDRSPIAASRREAFEETDLRVRKGQRVAELRVRIDGTRTKVRVQIIKSTRWTGRLKNKSGEFKWLKFLEFSKIPWGLMPGERRWYEDVVVKGKRRLVHIHCGTDRKDVLSVRSRPLP